VSVERYIEASERPARFSIGSRFSDVLLAGGVLAIIGLMILPLPTLMIDALVAFNITFGVLLLLTTLYIRQPLDFSAFPAVLLISTLFRLALSIATTRMILVQAHAGDIIQAFGTMVAGGNLVVGLVVYLIIVVVQFIVIAKGAERVAEVAARFTLDSMPGKQLSIDSDLRSGLIDKDEARRKRRTLELESKLHGSLDGAMKFVKGDAIASIVIVVVNLLGGLTIGVLQRDMAMGDALRTYSILTIGEGLVAQIPALLGAMAAGLMVTRTIDEEREAHLGDAIRGQLLANPRVLIFSGGIAAVMAIVPGFPAAVFLGLAMALLGAGAALHPRLKPRLDRLVAPARDLLPHKPAPVPATLIAAPAEPKPIVPLLLELDMPGATETPVRQLQASLTEMLESMQYRAGIPLPKIALHIRTETDQPGWHLLAFETEIGSGGAAALPEGTPDIVRSVREVLRRNLSMFMGVQETTTILNRIGADYPEVVKEAVRAVPTARIAEVFRRLIEEEVPLRHVRDVLEGIAEAGGQERDAGRIADLTRIAVRRALLGIYAPGGALRALVISAEAEEMIRRTVRVVDGVERLALEPTQARDLVISIGAAAESTGAAALLTAFDIRRAVRKLIEPDLFDLPVLSFNELTPAIKLDVVGQIAPPIPALPGSAGAPPALAAE